MPLIRMWPLVLMLHGGFENPEAGITDAELDGAIYGSLIDRTLQGRHFPAVIIAPKKVTRTWEGNRTCALIEWAKQHYRIDSKRVYVTGASAGGWGTWITAAACADKVAAAVPLCGVALGLDLNPLVTQNVSVWTFVNRDDLNSYYTDIALDTQMPALGALNHLLEDNPAPVEPPGGFRDPMPLGLKPTMTAHLNSFHRWEWSNGITTKSNLNTEYERQIHYTLAPSGGHDVWTSTYNNEDMYQWMFRQVKK
jgi:predicted peptidase